MAFALFFYSFYTLFICMQDTHTYVNYLCVDMLLKLNALLSFLLNYTEQNFAKGSIDNAPNSTNDTTISQMSKKRIHDMSYRLLLAYLHLGTLMSRKQYIYVYSYVCKMFIVFSYIYISFADYFALKLCIILK